MMLNETLDMPLPLSQFFNSIKYDSKVDSPISGTRPGVIKNLCTKVNLDRTHVYLNDIKVIIQPAMFLALCSFIVTVVTLAFHKNGRKSHKIAGKNIRIAFECCYQLS